MRLLVMYDYPPYPSELSIQGDLLYRGLLELDIDAHAVHCQSNLEKEWYYRWFKPELVVSIGSPDHLQDLALHPQKHGITAVPWLVADGSIANYQELLKKLPLILVPANPVKEMYVRDGIDAGSIEVLPVGCDLDSFVPLSPRNPKIKAIREALDISSEQLMILTLVSDAGAKGVQEMMHALAAIDHEVPDWKYICKVWPQPGTEAQIRSDMELAAQLNIKQKVGFATDITSRSFLPYLMAACDIYAAPLKLEGFGMAQIEAGACEKPVCIPNPYDTEEALKVSSDTSGSAAYPANTSDIATHLKNLMADSDLRIRLGKAARRHVSEHFDYKVITKRLIEIIKEKLEIF